MSQFTESSFLDKYLDGNQLSSLPSAALDRLRQLEEELQDKSAEGGGDFGECVKTFGPQLADLSQRLGAKIKSLSVKSIRDAIDLIKYATNVGFEIHQIVDSIKDCVLPDQLPPEAQKQRQIDFSKDLAYFVWMTVNPLGDKLNWIPFKKTIEAKLVKWIAGMAVELASELIDKNEVTKASTTYIKAI